MNQTKQTCNTQKKTLDAWFNRTVIGALLIVVSVVLMFGGF